MTERETKLAGLVDVVLREGASDLHLVVGRQPTIRVAGSLAPLVREQELSAAAVEAAVQEMLSEDHTARLKEHGHVDLSFAFGNAARFRVNVYRERGNLAAAMRLIPTEIKDLKSLNLPDALEAFANRTQGFFLVVGPMGHGKSTTLASMINYINRTRAEHILTIEDPIEYLFVPERSIMNQREVRSDTENFPDALRAMLREDVNVLMIGEMRDIETMAAAVTAAETGHMVFATLHTNNAAQTIDRIIDSFPSHQQNQIRLQLSSALLGVFSQRLIPRVSGGRIPAYELMIANSAVKNLVREGKTHEIDIVIETSYEQGMVSLNRSLAGLVRAGEITIESARAYSLNPRSLDGLVSR